MQEEIRRSLVSCEPSPEGFVAVYAFAPELSIFEGHFPGRPLVPGVFLVEGVRQAAESVLECQLCLGEIADARFTSPVVPGEAVRLSVALESVAGEAATRSWVARAELECAGISCAKLRLRLGASPG